MQKVSKVSENPLYQCVAVCMDNTNRNFMLPSLAAFSDQNQNPCLLKIRMTYTAGKCIHSHMLSQALKEKVEDFLAWKVCVK